MLRQPDGAAAGTTPELKATIEAVHCDSISCKRGDELVHRYSSGFEELRVRSMIKAAL
jgi:hypothetical protein